MKNKVGKKFGAAFLASVMIMGMTACGSEESGQNVTENVAASTQEGTDGRCGNDGICAGRGRKTGSDYLVDP